MNHITLRASLVKLGELRSGASGDREWKALNITVAQNDTTSTIEGGKRAWKELPPKYWRLTLWGKTAEAFARANIPTGTRLLITGKYKLEVESAYTTKDGRNIPESLVDTIEVEEIAVSINNQTKRNITVTRDGESAPEVGQGTTPQQTAKSTPKEPSFTPVPEDDMFGDTLEPSTEFDDFFI